MATANSDFLVGEELDDLFFLLDSGALDEDLELDKDLDSVVPQESPDEIFSCDICDKVCKTRRGLTRHTNSKHSDPQQLQSTSLQPDQSLPLSNDPQLVERAILQKLHPLHLKKMLEKSALECPKDNVFTS